MSSNIPAYFNYQRPEVVARFDPKGLRILDVGCAAGAMGSLMLQKGAVEVVGIERDEQASKIARTRLSMVHRADLDTCPALPYPDGYFDVITCADVLEHLVEPGALLGHLRRYLRDGGRLVSSIPNVRHESVVVPLVVHGRFSYAEAGVLDKTHLRFFTLAEYVAFLQRCGFSVEPQMGAVTSAPTPALEKLAEAVAAAGGDAAAFRSEATVIQFILVASPARSLESLALGDSPVPREALGNQWAGSRATRVLLVPNLEKEDDGWRAMVELLASDPAQAQNLTVGIALERKYLEQPPQDFVEFAQASPCNFLLTEAPSEPNAWERLMAGASMYIDTAGRSDLVALGRKVGAEVVANI